MNTVSFREIEIDAIGEILNISLGASATAMSTMLDARVDITTPIVKLISKEEFEFSKLEPAIAVEITYIEGLVGNNIMILKKSDVKVILEMLMGMSIPQEEFELDEMNQSAICEVMNQMMGASSTALSDFLGEVVNISTPHTYEIQNEMDFKEKLFENSDEQRVSVGFTLKVGDKIESEFINVMPSHLVKRLVSTFLPEEAVEEEKPVETITPPVVEKEITNTPLQSMETMQMQQQMLQQMMQMQQQMERMQQETVATSVETRTITPHAIPRPNLQNEGGAGLETEENMEMLLGVPLEVSVEIGRTKKLVKDILDLSKGSLVVLDKLAGEQVDLFVNGRCIAKGDVVVVEDNFGIRITEIVKKEKPNE